MANSLRARPFWWLPIVSLLGMAGCTVTFGEGLRKNNGDSTRIADGPLAPPTNPGAGGPPVAKAVTLPPGAPPDQISLLIQRLGSIEDERKIQAARLQLVESQLREKDKTVLQASYEIQESTAQMKKAREDLHRWKTEMDELRGKLRMMEQENKVTLEAILKTLEQFIDKESFRAKP